MSKSLLRQISGVSFLGLLLTVVVFGLGGPQAGVAQHENHAKDDRKPENWTGPNNMHLFLCAFHVAKDDAKFQIQAHHYCSPAGEDIHQCVVFDSTPGTPKLLGVEYIITNEAYQKLPAAEKKYWHPHAYEITSGQLIAPDMEMQGDKIFPGLIETWGKTWHTWRDPADKYPMGEPRLMWSAGGDGQIDQKLIDKRDAAFGVKTAEIRERRKPWGFPVPNISPAKSLDEVGRKWTTSGADEPAKTKP